MKRYPKQSGFTLVEIMIVVAVIGLLMSVAVPNLVRARETARKTVCIENLSQIESAKQLLSIERKLKDGDPVDFSELIGDALYIKKVPECPTQGTYLPLPIGEQPECSLGATLDHKIE